MHRALVLDERRSQLRLTIELNRNDLVRRPLTIARETRSSKILGGTNINSYHIYYPCKRCNNHIEYIERDTCDDILDCSPRFIDNVCIEPRNKMVIDACHITLKPC